MPIVPNLSLIARALLRRSLSINASIASVAIFTTLSIVVLPSCGTTLRTAKYEGPQVTHDDEDVGGPAPTISWSGEQKYIRPDEPFRFDWPVDDARMSRGFLTGKKNHWGLDLANKRGTPILASERGIVIYTGKGFRGYGNLIVIEHNEEWATLYSHLHKIEVEEGQAVQQGQRIGQMGRTGRASGVHLHFEIRHNRQPVNPLPYLPQGF